MTDREAVLSLKRVNAIYGLLKPLSNEEIAKYSKEMEERLDALAEAGFPLRFEAERYVLREPREQFL